MKPLSLSSNFFFFFYCLLVQSEQHFTLSFNIKTMLKLINDRNKEDHRRGDAVLKDNQILKINMDVFQVHKLKGFWDKVLKKDIF